MTIEQKAVQILSLCNPTSYLAQDVLDLAIYSIIGFHATKRIMNTTEFPEYKESDMLDLLDEMEHMNFREMVNGFLNTDFEITDEDPNSSGCEDK